MTLGETELMDFLSGAGLASRRNLEDASLEAKRMKVDLGRMLVMKGLVTEKDLKRAVSYVHGFPYINLVDADLRIDCLKYIPEPLSRKWNAVAFDKKFGFLHVALLDPSCLPEIKFVENLHDLVITPHLTDTESIRKALRAYQELLKKDYGASIEEHLKALDSEPNDDNAGNPHARKMMDSLINHALVSRAHEIHIEPYERELVVRYRFGDKLVESMILPSKASPWMSIAAKDVAGADRKSSLPQEGRFKIDTDTESVSYRVSTMPTRAGEKILMRRVPSTASGFTFESLGIEGLALEHLHQAINKRSGLVIVSSPPQSGKTTFLYTILDMLQNENLNIQTIEEKIEFILPRINQTELRPEIGLDAARALRAAINQRPDVIMISDISNAETARLAVAAASKGILVLAGLSSNSASSAIRKFSDFGVDDKLLGSALVLSVSMRLLTRLGSKEKYFLNKEEIKSLGYIVSLERMLDILKEGNLVTSKARWENVPFWRDVGGKWGRDENKLAIFEVIPANQKVKDLVMNGSSGASIDEEAARAGNISLVEEGIVKAVGGYTTLEEVLRAVS